MKIFLCELPMKRGKVSTMYCSCSIQIEGGAYVCKKDIQMDSNLAKRCPHAIEVEITEPV